MCEPREREREVLRIFGCLLSVEGMGLYSDRSENFGRKSVANGGNHVCECEWEGRREKVKAIIG